LLEVEPIELRVATRTSRKNVLKPPRVDFREELTEVFHGEATHLHTNFNGRDRSTQSDQLWPIYDEASGPMKKPIRDQLAYRHRLGGPFRRVGDRQKDDTGAHRQTNAISKGNDLC
jgi:hypothetical protein